MAVLNAIFSQKNLENDNLVKVAIFLFISLYFFELSPFVLLNFYENFLAWIFGIGNWIGRLQKFQPFNQRKTTTIMKLNRVLFSSMNGGDSLRTTLKIAEKNQVIYVIVN